MAPQTKGRDAAIQNGVLPDRIAATFSNQTLMITGGTGFMGKVLLEKILRKCSDIKELILLVRPKKGMDPYERIENIFRDPLFEEVVELRGMATLIGKVKVVCGDAVEPDLGISEEDREYIKANTDIFIHGAASVKFDEPLKKVINLHVRGTRCAIELAKSCKKLKVFVHVSTAYCHNYEHYLEEKPYPPRADPHAVIAAASLFDEETIESMKDKFLGDAANTYTYTKGLAEWLPVEAKQAGLPVLIVRPSIVIPISEGPIPGWTDNLNGPGGLLLGAGKGVIRSMYGMQGGYADFVPVDMFINFVMITMWNYLSNGDKDNWVVNITSSEELKLTWIEMIDIGRGVSERVPLNNIAWYPGGSIKSSKIYHYTCVLLFHYLPALLVDTLLFLLSTTGVIKHKPFLIRVQNKVTKGMRVLEYFTCHQFRFRADFMKVARTKLNGLEKVQYKIDAEGFDIEKYFENCARAGRRYLLKESDDTLPAARRHMKIMWLVDRTFKILFWSWLAWTLYNMFL